jgi:hypothetical protein
MPQLWHDGGSKFSCDMVFTPLFEFVVQVAAYPRLLFWHLKIRDFFRGRGRLKI